MVEIDDKIVYSPRSRVVHIFPVVVVDLHQFLNMSLLLGQGKVEDTEVVFGCLRSIRVTKRLRTSLLSSMRASWVRQRVELTMVAEYPATAVQIAISLMAVVRRILRTMATVGTRIPKKVEYVQRVIELVTLADLDVIGDTFLPRTLHDRQGSAFGVCFRL